MKPYRTILIATDFSKPATRAFAHALALATACRARLRVVHVVAPYERAYFEHVGATKMGDGDVEVKLQSRLEAHVKKLLGRSRVRCTAELVWGEPAEKLVSLGGPGDLMVMGARGLGEWASLILGSVAEKVVRHARVPVLVVTLPHARPAAVKKAKRAA